MESFGGGQGIPVRGSRGGLQQLLWVAGWCESCRDLCDRGDVFPIARKHQYSELSVWAARVFFCGENTSVCRGPVWGWACERELRGLWYIVCNGTGRGRRLQNHPTHRRAGSGRLRADAFLWSDTEQLAVVDGHCVSILSRSQVCQYLWSRRK